MNHVIQLPFGTLTFMSFPEHAENFKDFPDGRFRIVSNSKGADNGQIYYKLDLTPPQQRRTVTDETIHTTVNAAVNAYLQNEVLSKRTDNPQILSGMKDLVGVVEWAINPAAVKGTLGTVQLIHGSSSSNRGYNNFEIYLPRGFRFRMVGNPLEIDGPVERSQKLLPPLWDRITGDVMFANKQYRFAIMEPATMFNMGRKPPRPEVGDEALKTFFLKNRGLAHFMDKQHAMDRVRTVLYGWFNFIEEYQMLGEFRFDTDLPIDEYIKEYKNVNEKYFKKLDRATYEANKNSQ